MGRQPEIPINMHSFCFLVKTMLQKKFSEMLSLSSVNSSIVQSWEGSLHCSRIYKYNKYPGIPSNMRIEPMDPENFESRNWLLPFAVCIFFGSKRCLGSHLTNSGFSSFPYPKPDPIELIASIPPTLTSKLTQKKNQKSPPSPSMFQSAVLSW